MSIVQGTLPVGSLDHTITLNVQSSGGSHFETVTDTTPYLHRASPQDVASSMKLQKIVGGTIAWNQGNPNPKFALGTTGYQGIGGTFTVTDGVAQVVIATTLQYAYSCRVQRGVSASIKDHKYLLSAEASLSVNGKVRAYIGQMSGTPTQADVNANQYVELNTIYKSTTTGNGAITVSTGDDFAQRSIGDILYVKKMCVYDLTQMFGSTIADYIYSLEQAHAGDGVAWFKALFPNDYYAYDSGELISVKTSARKTYNADNVEIGSYPLDSDLELRGIPKLDADHKLYYDGDTYASDGTVTRKYGIRAYTSGDASDGSTMITDGTNTVYKLITPTTESADAYTQSQRVGATEEFVDGRTVEIPVGNVSEYKRLIQED